MKQPRRERTRRREVDEDGRKQAEDSQRRRSEHGEENCEVREKL